MMTSPQTGNDNKGGGNEILSLVIILSDTTWRICLPTIGLALVGLKGDLSYGTKPWLTLLGTAVGFAVAAFLIKLQLRDTT
jgi:hypothetical protein